MPTPPTPTVRPQELFQYAPFARCSVNLISCSSNSGKTQFLTQIVRHRDRFFQDPDHVRRILFVNGNQRDVLTEHPWSADPDFNENPADADADADASSQTDPSTTTRRDLQVLTLSLEDLKDLGTVLCANDVLVIDDLLQINDDVLFLVKYGCHHYRLTVFLITQACLSSPLYSLLRLSHNLILLFGNTATTRLAQHLVQSFFLCTDTKAYLKAIFGIAERQQDIVVLKLNAVASYRPHSSVLALSRVQGLFDAESPHCFVYPELGRAQQLENGMMSASEATAATADLPRLEGDYLEQAYVLLPASRVRQNRTADHDDPGGSNDKDPDDCLKEKEKHWNEMALFLEREIENSFPLKRWTAAKNLTRELLRCNQLCISPDFRTVFVAGKPSWRFGIVDFLHVATRKNGPSEAVSDKVSEYQPLVNILLRHDVPETYFINKLLLSASKERGSRGSRRSRSRPPPGGRNNRRQRQRPRHRNNDFLDNDYDDYNNDDFDDARVWARQRGRQGFGPPYRGGSDGYRSRRRVHQPSDFYNGY